MVAAQALRAQQQPGDPEERAAFRCLHDAILASGAVVAVEPRCALLPDQIVWARSPARLDLAGGWTDTPPYCLRHGGQVVNVAVDLNGQPPIQVFVRRTDRHTITIHSIDRGAAEVIETYEQLDTYARPGSAFALARAALAQAGFLPRFHSGGGCATLERQLDTFGGGLEVSLLAAVPQGSGLGTSSILAATLLGALSDVCGLGWSRETVIARTMALEQMMTTGGGWQDQVGGVLPGIKLAETRPGPDQTITARWLPDTLFAEGCASGRVLMYYTGVTRVAKDILQQIVRGMFLNEAERLAILLDIGANAGFVADALQRLDWAGFAEGIRRSWDLNQRIDAGTNPPAVQEVLEPVQEHLAACKLLGAGGGGYLLMLAHDEDAGRRIRRALADVRGESGARFVDVAVSHVGLQVTRS